MKLCVSNIAWSHQENNQHYHLLQQHGISYLEVAPFIALEKGIYATEDDLNLFRKTLCRYGLSLISLQSLLFGIPREMALFEGEAKRQELKQTLREVIDFAAQIGVKNLVFGSPKQRIILNWEEQDAGIQLFKEIGDYAYSNGVVLAVEPNAAVYGTNFVNTLEEAIDFIEKVQSKGVALNFDLGTFILEEETIENFKRSYPYIHHVHMSAPYLHPLTNVSQTLMIECLRYLKKMNYQGGISIEMKKTDEGLISVEQAIRYLKQAVDQVMA